MLQDVGTERAVLGALCQFGLDAYVDIDGMVKSETFTTFDNQVIYKALQEIFARGVKKVDTPTLLGELKTLNFDFADQKKLELIRSLFNNSNIHLENVNKFASKIINLAIGRSAQNKHQEALQNLGNLTGNEGVEHILSLSETPILSLMKELGTDKEQPKKIGNVIDTFVENKFANPIDMIGIPTPFPIYNSIIGGGIRTGVTLVGARPKCLEINTPVLTESGYKPIKNIKIGDKLFDRFGKSCKVINTYKPYKDQLYEIIFNDGHKIKCNKDHLWYVNKMCHKKEEKILTTNELKNDLTYREREDNKWSIKTTGLVNFSKQKLEIDPYIVGVILGDGSLFNHVKFYTMDMEIVENIKMLVGSDNVKLDQILKNNKAQGFRINGLIQKFKNIGLWKHNCYNKFVPKQYLYSSINDRISLLQGLMDTDGSINTIGNDRGRLKYCSVSLQLVLDIKFLVESLGGLFTYNEQFTRFDKDSEYKKSYCCNIRFNNGIIPFRLARKNQHLKTRKMDVKRVIKSINKIETGNVVCIEVDSPDNSFLIDGCLPTHNCGKSTFAKETAYYVSSEHKIPVLYLDTEMGEEDQLNRMLASLSNVNIAKVETGKCNEIEKEKILRASQKLKNIPFYHKRIGGKEFAEVLAIVRRWLYQEVGFGDNAKPKRHLIIYDYFKLMSSDSLESMAEHQALGFQISALSDFCGQHDSPVLAFVQLNRDGITNDTTASVSQSDRLVWLCTSFSIFKRKNMEEIASDGAENGNMKLLPIECRFGKALDGNYINMNMRGEIASLSELNTQKEAIDAGRKNKPKFKPKRNDSEQN